MSAHRRLLAAALLIAMLAGCTAAVREEGRRVTERQHALLHEAYDCTDRAELDEAELYALEDRLALACAPLDSHAFGKLYPDDPVRDFSRWDKVMAIFACRHTLDLVCLDFPRLCGRRRDAGRCR